MFYTELTVPSESEGGDGVVANGGSVGGPRPAPRRPAAPRSWSSARRVAGRRGASSTGRLSTPYFAGLPACRADRRGPAGLGDAGAFLAAGFLAAGFLADLAAGLGAGAFFGVALGLATVCARGVA